MRGTAINATGAQTSGTRISLGVGRGEQVVVHEFAHALGFKHEYQRKDSPASAGTWDEITSGDQYCDDGIRYFDSNDEPACIEPLTNS